jgi:sugar phosphate isomerase/epimerase
MVRLAITTQKRDISQHVALALKHQVGIEIQVYGYDPNLLDNDWQELVRAHKAALMDFAGDIAVHGAFFDMSSASIDRRLVALTRERYLTSLRVAAELGARNVIFHANFLPFINHPQYLPDWTERQIGFWGEMIPEAQSLDLVIALENMWEPDPDIIGNVIREINSPHLGACLDVGHVHLYTNSLSIKEWIEQLAGTLVHCHVNNNPGAYDKHLALDAKDGIVDYATVIPLLKALPNPPLISLEMEHLEDQERSLLLFHQ